MNPTSGCGWTATVVRVSRSVRGGAVLLAASLLLAGCGAGDDRAGTAEATGVPEPVGGASGVPAPSSPARAPSGSASVTPTASAVGTGGTRSTAGHAARVLAGNPDGHAPVPAAARAEDTSHPTRVIGNGTRASCTSAAVVAAVAKGGIITFSCGPDPVTITLARTARVRNDHGPRVVLDGGGRVTLSGGGKRRILYMNTCDQAQVWTTSHCQDQDHPRLTVQNLTFVDGNATGETAEGGGGGAIFVRGGRLTIVNSRFLRNRCDAQGPDVGGAAVRVLSQYQGKPVHVVRSTFGGASGQGGRCSNGGALSSIGVSWVVLNSVISHNSAIGRGANPARSGTPGGGSGGGIYADGNTFTVRVEGSRITDNHATEGGGAIFFVSNDRTGTLDVRDSVLRRNPSDGFGTSGYPGIFFLGAGRPRTSGSTLR